MNQITAQELKNITDANNYGRSYVIIDVREELEYEMAHVKGTLHIPLGKIKKQKEDFSDFDDIYIHCQSGGRSGVACDLLKDLGISNAINIEGGIMAMQRVGFLIV